MTSIASVQNNFNGYINKLFTYGQFTDYDSEQYKSIVSERIAKVQATTTRDFSCKISKTKLNNIYATHVRSDPIELIRTPELIKEDKQSQYLIGLNLVGSFNINHYSETVNVQESQIYLIDKASPYHSCINNKSERILFSIPRMMLEERLADPSKYLSTCISLQSPMGKLVGEHFLFLMQNGRTLKHAEKTQLIDISLDLIALSFKSIHNDSYLIDTKSLHSQALFSKIKAYIRCVIDDPEISPSKIADELGLSKRYLHKIFSDNDTTFGTWLRQERLMRAHALLTDNRYQALTITEIALRLGFNDISNFSRQFKVLYKETPSSIRSGCRQ